MLTDKKNIVKIIKLVEAKKIKIKDACDRLHISQMGFYLIRKRYNLKGDKAFIHGLKNKRSNRKTPIDIVKKIIKSYSRDFIKETFTLFYEEFCLENKIKLSLSTISRLLKQNGFSSPQSLKRKNKNPHNLRPRCLYFGELIQMDATPFQWFSRWDDTIYYTLHGAIDDATGKILALAICENECSYGYFNCVFQIVNKYGIPKAIYTDKSGIFTKNPRRDMTIIEQIEYEKRQKDMPKTQWGRMCDELKINHILANSPQAKGRVERMWRTIQNRLPYWIKKNNIKTVEQLKNRLDDFIDYFNSRFELKCDTSVFLAPPKNWKNSVCIKISRKVLNGGIVKFEGLRIKTQCKAGSTTNLIITENGLFTDNFKSVTILDDYYNLNPNAPQVLQKIIYDFMFKNAKAA